MVREEEYRKLESSLWGGEVGSQNIITGDFVAILAGLSNPSKSGKKRGVLEENGNWKRGGLCK